MHFYRYFSIYLIKTHISHSILPDSLKNMFYPHAFLLVILKNSIKIRIGIPNISKQKTVEENIEMVTSCFEKFGKSQVDFLIFYKVQ